MCLFSGRCPSYNVAKKLSFFFKKPPKIQEKGVLFCLKCTSSCYFPKLPLFSILVCMSHIKCRPTTVIWIGFIFLVYQALDSKWKDHITVVNIFPQKIFYKPFIKITARVFVSYVTCTENQIDSYILYKYKASDLEKRTMWSL